METTGTVMVSKKGIVLWNRLIPFAFKRDRSTRPTGV